MQFADKPAAIPQLLVSRTITNAMFWLWISRQDLQKTYSLLNKQGQQSYIDWFHSQTQELGPRILTHKTIGIKYVLSRIYRKLPKSARVHAKRSWSILILILSVLYKALYSKQSIFRPIPAKSFGCNLIGWANADLGMGEHLRMSAHALAGTDIPHGVLNYSIGITHTQRSRVNHSAYIDSPIYPINIFHVNADQIWPVYSNLGPELFGGRYNIGYWAWELSRCPQDWYFPIQLMDEIWAPSVFIQECFTRYTHKPVIHMPLCVDLPNVSGFRRSDFGLFDSDFVFLCFFDFHSYIARKNPYGTIISFKNEFNRFEHARLIIKVMHADTHSIVWKNLMSLVSNDSRIIVINQNYTRLEILSLIKMSDSLVSLHRSEGFGRGPAEAMYMGKPVIVTNYSGNTDFTRAGNSCLVNYKMVPVGVNEYAFGEGQMWAEPDTEHASFHMRSLVENPELARMIGIAGQSTILSEYNSKVIGERYSARISALAESNFI